VEVVCDHGVALGLQGRISSSPASGSDSEVQFGEILLYFNALLVSVGPGKLQSQTTPVVIWQRILCAAVISAAIFLSAPLAAGNADESIKSHVVYAGAKSSIPGDDETQPLVIGALPFDANIPLYSFSDDYSWMPVGCDGLEPGPNQPDAVYLFTPPETRTFTISVCGPMDRTNVYLYEQGVTNGTFVACGTNSCHPVGLPNEIGCITAVGGVPYYIVVEGPASPVRLHVSYCCNGDSASIPIDIPTLPYVATGSTTHCDDNFFPGFCGDTTSHAPDVVYQYTSPVDAGISIDLCASAYDTRVSVYAGAFFPGTLVGCSDNACGTGGTRSRLECIPVYGNYPYYIVIDGAAGQSGNYTLSVNKCFPGDSASIALEYQGLNNTRFGSTQGCSNDYEEACASGPSAGPDIVYRYQALDDGSVRAILDHTTFDSRLFIYEDQIVPGAPYRCNDDAPGGADSGSYVPCFNMSAGHIYYIVIDGATPSDSGSFHLQLRRCAPTCGPVVPCLPGDVVETGECGDYANDVNGGCNGTPGGFSYIAPGMAVCGSISADGVHTDYDFYQATLYYNDSVTVCYHTSFPAAVAGFGRHVYDPPNGTGYCESFIETYLIQPLAVVCRDTCFSFRVPYSGYFEFAIGPPVGMDMLCVDGPWTYRLSMAEDFPCHCLCSHDPECDNATDILDVTHAIEVAFRNGDRMADLSPLCPWARTDVNCDGATDIFDVTKLINVAFRNGNPATEFCNPCP
jgi:hypothetical protein